MTTNDDALREALELGLDYAREALARHDQAYQRHRSTEAERALIAGHVEQIEKAIAASKPAPHDFKEWFGGGLSASPNCGSCGRLRSDPVHKPEPQAQAEPEDWKDGINVARLRAALTRMGIATNPSEEGMAADLENWINTLTRAVTQPHHQPEPQAQGAPK